MPENFLVFVECMTFNHHSYIEDAMNGFCMQKTDFPYLCVVMDDCSTDGEQDVINNYVAKHFDILSDEVTDDYVLNFCQHKTNINCYFAVFYLKYNHFSIKKDKIPYYIRWRDNSKYIALCEGDDYWVDEKKLQIQADFLEKNAEYYSCCHQSLAIKPDKTPIHLMWDEKKMDDYDISTLNGYMDFPHTATYFFYNPNNVHNKTQKFITNYALITGWDKSLVLFLFSMGKIRYFAKQMSCYRVSSGYNITSIIWKENWTQILEKNEAHMLMQVKEYNLNIDIRPHYYRNALFYAIRFWWHNKTKENCHWIWYVWKRTPNKLYGVYCICKLIINSLRQHKRS